MIDSIPSGATTDPQDPCEECLKCLGRGIGTWDHDTGCELPVIQCDCCNGSGQVEEST